MKINIIALCCCMIYGTAYAEYNNPKPSEACNFMAGTGLATSGYKTMEGLGEYYCVSQPKKLGEGYPLSNTINYHVTGEPKNVKKVYLMLNVNQKEQAQAAYESLLRDAELLTKKALNATMPKMTKKSIKEGVTGQWKINKATVKIMRSDWPTGKGHDIKYIIE